MEKRFISAQELLDVSFQLGGLIVQQGYRPNFIVGVWRGGAPVGIAVQEILDACGVAADHIAIRTSSYHAIGQRAKEVRVHGLRYIEKRVNAEDKLLIVDDIFDTGLSVAKVISELHKFCRKNTPEIKVATPFYKPTNNQTSFEPDFHLEKTDKWLVFPHELEGLSFEEIKKHKPEVLSYIQEAKRRNKSESVF